MPLVPPSRIDVEVLEDAARWIRRDFLRTGETNETGALGQHPVHALRHQAGPADTLELTAQFFR